MNFKKDPLNNKAHSRQLAHTINAYWEAQGKPWIKAYVETQEYDGKSKTFPNEIFVVRSNMKIVQDSKGNYSLERKRE